MRKLSALFSFTLIFILYLTFPKSAFALLYCNSHAATTYVLNDTVPFDISADGLSAIPEPGTLSLSVQFNDGTYIGGFPPTAITTPVQDSQSTTVNYTASSTGTHSGWGAILSYVPDSNPSSTYSWDCSNSETITVNAPPPNLESNASFSGMSPNGGTLNNPVNFSGTISDSDPNSGTRTVTVTLDDGTVIGSGTYEKGGGFNGSGAYTVSTPPYTNRSWTVSVSLGSSTASQTYYFNMQIPPPDLESNASISMSPTSGSFDSPVNYSLSITDSDPNPGTRTVSIYLDSDPPATTTYVDNAGYSTSGQYSLSPGTHSWSVTVSMSGSSKTAGPYSFNIKAPGPDPVAAPYGLDAVCSSPGGQFDGTRQWCNTSPNPYIGIFSVAAPGPATFNFDLPGAGLVTVSDSPSRTSDIPQSANGSSSLGDGTYTWSAWSSGTGWESGHTYANFGIDSVPPVSGPGTPFITQEGGTWKIKWSSNGADNPGGSGIGFVMLDVTDRNNPICTPNFSFGTGGGPGPVTITETNFINNCTSLAGPNEPVPGHVYDLLVTSCDFAGNCEPGPPGLYDGSITPTYSIYGSVFVDYNGDGIRNSVSGFPPDEEYSGGDVQIYMNGTPTVNTDSFGNYMISNLTNGNYSLEAVPPAGYIVSTANPITAFINNADSFGNDFGIRPLGGPQPTSTPPPAGYPVVKSLKANNPSTLSFTGTFGISGRQDTENGSKWLNPLRVRLYVQQGTSSINRYFVAFYDKDTTTGTKLTTSTTFLQSMKDRLNPAKTIATSSGNKPGSPKNGFLLGYGQSTEFSSNWADYLYNNFYVWDKNAWKKIPSTGTQSQTITDGTTSLFTVTRVGTGTEAATGYRFITWEIKINKDLTSRNFYTPAYVIDSSNRDDFNSNLTITQL